MARITVEDCLRNVDNRFELVLLAARRARQIANGVEPMVAEENDKPTVLALREIAGGHIDEAALDKMEEQQRRQAEQDSIAEAMAEAEAEEN